MTTLPMGLAWQTQYWTAYTQLYFIPTIHPNDKHRDPTTDHTLGISSKGPGSSPLYCTNYSMSIFIQTQLWEKGSGERTDYSTCFWNM